MKLNELITYVRQIAHRPVVDRPPSQVDPLLDGPNAPRIKRPKERPPWLGQDVVTIKDPGDIVVELEREISIDDLPEDLHASNPPIETLAYYLPFHLYGEDWGIYLRESGILYVACVLKGSKLVPGDAGFIKRGQDILLNHEDFHFRAEVACSRAEVVAKVRLYDAYFGDGCAAAHEEALANAAAFKRLGSVPSAMRETVAEWMKGQGSGYQDYVNWIGGGKFRAGCRLASQHMLKFMRAHRRTGSSAPSDFLFDAIGRFKSPIYVVPDVSLASILKPFPKAYGMQVFVHSLEHPPPHIHIDIPPGRHFTRYAWPKLKALERDPSLSKRQKKDLYAYLALYGAEIDTKVQAVFTGALPWTPNCDAVE